MSRVSDKPYFVYVLWSSSGRRFYIGISEDPKHRLLQHNSSNPAAWSRRYRPWDLVHSERYPDYSSARRRELELKSQKGGNGFFVKTGLDPFQFRGGA
jgi:putative endonuclease